MVTYSSPINDIYQLLRVIKENTILLIPEQEKKNQIIFNEIVCCLELQSESRDVATIRKPHTSL